MWHVVFLPDATGFHIRKMLMLTGIQKSPHERRGEPVSLQSHHRQQHLAELLPLLLDKERKGSVGKAV